MSGGWAQRHGAHARECNHFFKAKQFSGRVTFVECPRQKEHAFILKIRKLGGNSEKAIAEQSTPESLGRALIGCIDICFMKGKKSPKE
jgi:hypothetical protein